MHLLEYGFYVAQSSEQKHTIMVYILIFQRNAMYTVVRCFRSRSLLCIVYTIFHAVRCFARANTYHGGITFI